MGRTIDKNTGGEGQFLSTLKVEYPCPIFMTSKLQMLSIICVVLLFFLLLIPFPKRNDCYDFHVEECLNAHKLNKTFLLCSGFFVEPSDSDFDSGCAIHPLEDCYKEVPHGCNLVQNEYIVGVCFGLLNVFCLEI